MKFVYRTILLLSLCVLALVVMYGVYGQHSKFYFSDSELRNNLVSLIFLLCPLALLGTLFGTLRPGDSSMLRSVKVAVTVILTIFLAVGFYAAAAVSEPHNWVDMKTLYVNKYKPEWRIVEQADSEGN